MGSERGYVGMRLLVVLASVVVAVWMVPFVLVRSDDVARSQTPRVAPTATVSGPTAGVPLAEPPLPAATGGIGPAANPIEAAEDVQAQSTLNEAIRVAQVWYAEHGSFAGFGPDAAGEYDPSIVYTEGDPAPNLVSMTVTPSSVVFVTIAGDAGGYLCAAATGSLLSFGRTDATDPGHCHGGWE